MGARKKTLADPLPKSHAAGISLVSRTEGRHRADHRKTIQVQRKILRSKLALFRRRQCHSERRRCQCQRDGKGAATPRGRWDYETAAAAPGQIYRYDLSRRSAADPAVESPSEQRV